MFRAMLMVAALVFAATGLAAETPTTKVATFGHWAVFTMPVNIAMEGDSGVMLFDAPFCAAQVGNQQTALLRLVFLFDDMNVVQVASPKWDFARRTGKVELKGEPSLVFMNATYAEAFVERISGGAEAGQVVMMMELMGEDTNAAIEVIDHSGRKIVTFPANGMSAAIRRAQQCAEAYR